jgi:hypothetical protein
LRPLASENGLGASVPDADEFARWQTVERFVEFRWYIYKNITARILSTDSMLANMDG